MKTKLKEYWKETRANSNTYCSKCNYNIKKRQIILTHYKNGSLVGILCQGCHVGWNTKVVIPKN